MNEREVKDEDVKYGKDSYRWERLNPNAEPERSGFTLSAISPGAQAAYKEKSRTNEVVIECWPFAEMERQSDEHTQRHYWLLKYTIPLFVIVWLIALMGAVGFHTGAWGPILKGIVQLFGFGVIFLMMVGREPTFIKIDAAHIKLDWIVGGESKRKKIITWGTLNSIEMVSGFGAKAVVFKDANKRELARLKLSTIGTKENWKTFVSAVRKWDWHPIAIDDSIEEALSSDMKSQTYTEIWLDALSAAPKRERLQPLSEGTSLRGGQYSIVRQIGVGGQGTAYLAQGREQSEQVVLKEYMLPVYVDIKARRRALTQFEHEAEVLRSLTHPQIVKLIDHFVEDHRAYLVLEYIDGSSLRSKVESDGPEPERSAKALALSMCDILTYLHSQSPPVIHRDFTPDNLLLDSGGHLKLIDFMVAQQGEQSATATVVGKHAYLPPEQFRGHATTRSDIYALGASLYFLLIGQDPEPLSQSYPLKMNANLNRGWDAIISKATAFEESERYESAAQMAADLDRMLQESSSCVGQFP